MNKKLLLSAIAIITFCAMPINSIIAVPNTPITNEFGIKIDLTVNYDKTNIGIQHPKAPIQVPTIYQNSHTLFLGAGCDNVEIILFDTSGVEVFSYHVYDETNSVDIPTNLSGTYELHIHRGNYCFFGEIEL